MLDFLPTGVPVHNSFNARSRRKSAASRRSLVFEIQKVQARA
jgi:hypothetical protein